MENLLTIIGILVISTWLIVHYYKINETTPVSRYRESLLLLAMILFVFITRIPRIENIEHNVDTSVWIASILALKVFPDKLWVFLNYTDSRPLTVLPLYLVSLLGVEINYISTEIVAVVIWLTIGLILHKTFQLFISTELSLILVWLLWMVIATSHFSDYNVYNSEPPGILAITLCTYWYLKFRKTGRISPYKTVLLGFCLGSLPYIKFQNIPMGLVIGAFSLVAMAQLKYWKLIGLLILSALLPTLLMNIYYLMVGKLSDFWVNYFWNYYYYSYSTQFSSMPIYERFGWNRVKWFILSIETSKWFLRGLIACNIIFMFWWIKSKIDLFRFFNFSFAVLLVFTSFYAILQAGNDFPHYILYIFRRK